MYKIKAHSLYNVSHIEPMGAWHVADSQNRSSRVRPTRTPDWTGVMFAASAIAFYLNLQPLRPTLSCYDQRLLERLSLFARCTAYLDDVSVWLGRLSDIDIDRAASTPSQSQVLVTSHNSPPLGANYYFFHTALFYS